MKFDAFRSQLFAHYENAQFVDGIALIETYSAEFPDHAQRLAYYHACLASKLGQTEQALDVLQAAVDANHWFAPSMLQNDEDLAPLRDSARFDQIIAASEARMMDALADSTPSRVVFEPSPLPDGPLPLLFALHGNEGSAKGDADRWDMLAEQGWLVVLPQSSQVVGPDRYVWNDVALANEDLLAQYAEISAEYTIDPTRIVVGGFSRGGVRSLELALSGDIPATGYIGICPSLGHLAPIDVAPANTALRCFITVGTRDRHLDSVQATASTLQSHGMAADVVPFEGTHQYPADMGTVLTQAVASVTLR